jgi:hypothetical protein
VPLTSILFRDDEDLQDCLVSDPDHVTPGDQGEHVGRIQNALMTLGAGAIAADEIEQMHYGPTTAQAVLNFKGPPRNILNTALGQVTPDNIVGKRTIAVLDAELVAFENRPPPATISLWVSLTREGSPHDHDFACPLDGGGEKVHHLATAINPTGLGRKINIGGEMELAYLGFEDFVTDKNVPLGRPMTDKIADGSASDIAVRFSPITPRGENEIRRIAMPGARLTIATNPGSLPGMEQIVQRLGGAVIERISMPFKSSPDGLGAEILVVVLPGTL